MIIIKITDGLGNQLFQYAYGKSIALLKKQPLLFDLNWFHFNYNNYTKRSFKINKFNIDLNEANDHQIDKIKRNNLPIIIRSVYWRIQNRLPYYKKHIVKEQSFNYDPNIFKCKNNVYLEGFWQSEKYFTNIRSSLINEIQLKEDISCNLYFQKITQSLNSVAMHIRRGDYLKPHSEHVALPLDYYKSAIDILNSKFNNLEYFIFSDDMNWTKEQDIFSKLDTTFVENQKEEIDLMLMSKCAHNIIANSSFSWWGAWLNQNDDKIVIAPKQWFKNENIDTSDLIPERWIIL